MGSSESAFEKWWPSTHRVQNEREEAAARAGWNAALDAAKEAMPDPVAVEKPNSIAGAMLVGSNLCLSTVDECLDALREKP